MVLLTNSTGCSAMAEAGTELGEAVSATVVSPGLEPKSDPLPSSADAQVNLVHTDTWRKRKLCELVGKPALLDEEQVRSLHEFLGEHHQAFCLEDGERGETDLVEMEIHTGDAPPRKQPARRMPFVVRQEVARQLQSMQSSGVIEPSDSPWASPVVMVRKKDGTHRFCIDYRELNTVTKADAFPLPRIDDLLDQLGDAKYFTTLDLAAGYWQIRVSPGSKEKTAFITPQGLYEFRVMPFGLTNAPAVFQRLMQRVLHGLNPEGGPDFVSVFIDDMLIWSKTLEGHLIHLHQVIERILWADLKLKPTKCFFIRREVEHLGHVLTPHGLTTSPRLVQSVSKFPEPQNVREVRQFIGLSSYYRRFIPHFSRIAQPLHQLTRKGAEYKWSDECRESFATLKGEVGHTSRVGLPIIRQTVHTGDGCEHQGYRSCACSATSGWVCSPSGLCK